MSKPRVLVTRRIPSSVLTRLEEAADVESYGRGDLPHEELIARIPGKQGLLSVVTDSIDRAVLARLENGRIDGDIAELMRRRAVVDLPKRYY